MALLIILLRALHIVGGVFWTGAAITLYGFVLPTVRATRPESARFVQHFAARSGINAWMTIASIAAVVGGLALFSPVSGSFDRDWMHSTRGIVLSVGALLGLAALAEGLAVTSPTARKLGALSAAVAAGGAPPTADQARQLGELEAKLSSAGTRGAVILALATALMAVARYI